MRMLDLAVSLSHRGAEQAGAMTDMGLWPNKADHPGAGGAGSGITPRQERRLLRRLKKDGANRKDRADSFRRGRSIAACFLSQLRRLGFGHLFGRDPVRTPWT